MLSHVVMAPFRCVLAHPATMWQMEVCAWRHPRQLFLLMALACPFFAGACTTIPLARADMVPAIIHHVQCEIKDARASLIGENPWLDSWATGFTLTIKAEQQENASPEISLLGPFGAGTFTLPIGAGVSGDAIRTATSKYIIRFDKLNLVDCNSPSEIVIDGTLGIKEWLADVLAPNQTNSFRIPDTIGHSMEFSITTAAHVNPSFTLTRSSGTGMFSAQHTDTHILDIAMTDATPAPEQHVIVDNPTGRPLGRPIVGAQSALTRTSPLIVRGRVVTGRSTIPADAKQRLENQLYELQIRSLFRR